MKQASVPVEPAIACSLVPSEFRERLAWIAELNRAALLDARRDGLRLILTYRREHVDQVREMVQREQQCCAFLGFDLKEVGNVLTLSIEAPESAADALDAVLGPFLSGEVGEHCDCAATATGCVTRQEHDGC